VAIAVGLDVHRGQITFEALDQETGEVSRGRIRPADRTGFRRWLQSWRGRPLTAAVEATTGWRFVVEELRRAGAEAHLAEPAEVADRRGSKRRAKTDRRDARHLRELLVEGRLPEAWIPPEHVLELRARVRLRRRSSIGAPSGWSGSTPSRSITASHSRSAASTAVTRASTSSGSS
jgi:transposase